MALQNLNIHDWLSLLPILNTGSNLQNIDRIIDIFNPIDLIKDVIKLIKIYVCPHPLQHHLRIPLSPGSRWFPLSSARAPQTNLILIQMMMIAMKLMMMTTTSLMRIMNDDLWILFVWIKDTWGACSGCALHFFAPKIHNCLPFAVKWILVSTASLAF